MRFESHLSVFLLLYRGVAMQWRHHLLWLWCRERLPHIFLFGGSCLSIVVFTTFLMQIWLVNWHGIYENVCRKLRTESDTSHSTDILKENIFNIATRKYMAWPTYRFALCSWKVCAIPLDQQQLDFQTAKQLISQTHTRDCCLSSQAVEYPLKNCEEWATKNWTLCLVR